MLDAVAATVRLQPLSAPDQAGESQDKIREALDLAAVLRRTGRLAEAEQGYRAILAEAPDRSDVLQGFARLLRQIGRHDEAVLHLQRVVELEPTLARAHNALGMALQGLSRTAEAAASFRRAVAADPDFAPAYTNLAAVSLLLGQSEEAEAAARRALELQPEDASVHNTLGAILEKRAQRAEAAECYRRAIALKPGYTDAEFALGNLLVRDKQYAEAIDLLRRVAAARPDQPQMHFALANALTDAGQAEEGIASYRRVIELAPAYAEGHRNLAVALYKLERPQESIDVCRRAVALKPESAEAHNILGAALERVDELDEALACFRRATELKPGYAEAHVNIAKVLNKQGRMEEALIVLRRCSKIFPNAREVHHVLGLVLMRANRLQASVANFRLALAADPDNGEARLGLAMALLKLGQWQEGWEEYERRWGTKQLPARKLERPWAGEPLRGKSILVHAEQGMGDVIQFVRYLPLLAELGANVAFVAPRPLKRLLQPLGQFARIDDAGEFNVHFQVPLLSLPRHFGTEPTAVPQRIPYLFAEPELVARWRARLGTHGFKVGICWQGNPKGAINEGRSPPLAQFIPLARLAGVRLISLQKNYGLDQLETLPRGITVETLGEDFDSGPDAFIDTAAVMESLDLVIACDTSVGHLAGALGRPVWVALQYSPHWPWLLDRSDTPWYPTMRLYRQRERGAWEPVFAAMAEDLARLVRDRRRPPGTGAAELSRPQVPVSWGELIDKITILEIKHGRLASEAARDNVRRELGALRQAWELRPVRSAAVDELHAALRTTNERLWAIEDDIREKEARQSFDADFIDLARTVYRSNDERSRIKREINALLQSDLVEEKQYAPYPQQPGAGSAVSIAP